MAASDDEEEVVPGSVTNYYFVDETESPISFSVLPIKLDDAEKPDTCKEQVFLHGTTDDGLQKVYKKVTAWKLKLGLKNDRPVVFVLSKDNKWIKLLKPRKSYEDSIRTILITIQLLHFLKKNPEASEKSLWDHLRKSFSTFEDRPSHDDLRDHFSLVKLYMERDDTLGKSQLLAMLLRDRRGKKTFGEDLQNDSDAKNSFIVDDVDEDMVGDDGDDSEDEDLFDSVCAICDNGGDLLCCEGKCMRSFHASKKAGEDSDCKSLGLSNSQVEAIQNFLCKNCKYKKHQCFACGKLGSSDKSAGAEVFRCSNGTCGHFYHPKCIADLVFPGNQTESAECQQKILAGETFTCTVHNCVVCHEVENKQVKELQFAMCRRCPKSYHRKCLPREIAFEDIEEEDIIQRAWDDLLPSRILIYCLKHEIDEDLGTPIRNHIIFPEIPEKRKIMDVQKPKVKLLVKKNRQDSDGMSKDRTSVKPIKVTEKISSAEGSRSFVKSSRNVPEQMIKPEKKLKPLKDSAQSDTKRADGGLGDVKRISKEKAEAVFPTVSPTASATAKKYASSFPVIDAATEKKITALMGRVSSSLSLADIIKKQTVPSTYAYSAKHIDKSITHGKVEVFVEAIRTALRKLENGGRVEDAKAVCEPDILKQSLKWSNKLKVYLAPFLHGMRYTSFGRHFTKVDKLSEIAERLQWYVQNGDTIVDFCCGANDFSRLMKEKLDAAGKKCLFKNYDIIQPKNDFNFEKRDWLKVHPRELPTGSQLIMGLNPPFGVKSALANKFIDKALTFKPKLLILIVPDETERLDKKNSRYDLIWEDGASLSGKSFYLPGSVDVHDKQMDQWNLRPPPLYLWSRPDWTAKHKAIALKQGHISKEKGGAGSAEEETLAERMANPRPAEEYIEKRKEKKDAAAPEEIRREGNNKTADNSTKRRSRKRRKMNRKQQEAVKDTKVSENRSSDMSISPPHSRNHINQSETHLPSEAFEIPPQYHINQSETHLPSEAFEIPQQTASKYGSISESASIPGVERTTSLDEIDDIAKRYTAPSNRDGLFSSSSHDWSNGGIGSHDYGIHSADERFRSYTSADTYGRNSYMDGYGRSSDADTRMQQARLYSMQGQEDLLQRNRFSLGSSEPAVGHTGNFPLSTYGLSSSTSGSSAMQRYAPRLDETNYPRPTNLSPGAPPFPGGRSSIFDMPGSRRDMHPDSLGFAPGPQHPFPQQGSGGWLND